MPSAVRVTVTFDPEARVWFTHSPDVHGLRLEGAHLDDLINRIPGALQDLLLLD